MSQIYSGEIRNGVVVFEGGPPALAEGTRVHVEVAGDSAPTLYERLKDFIGKAEGLPEDLAENHDHYLHGQPKR